MLNGGCEEHAKIHGDERMLEELLLSSTSLQWPTFYSEAEPDSDSSGGGEDAGDLPAIAPCCLRRRAVGGVLYERVDATQ